MRRDLLALFALAILVRGLAAWPQQQPNYMDAAYYYVNGANLAAGRGFVEDFAWNYLNPPDTLPQPSHLYWMPFTSMLAAAGMVLGGISYRAAQIPFILLSAGLAPLSYVTARVLSDKRGLAWLAGLLAIFSGFYMPFWTAIDNFTPFALAGAGMLLLTHHGVASDKLRPRPLIAAGVCAGVAHLSRADGPLLLIAVGLWAGMRWLQGAVSLRKGARLVLLLSIGYLLVMMPWFVRNWTVAGTPLPSAGTKTIWLTTYDDLFSYNRDLSAAAFFAQGWPVILQGRWWATVNNLQTVLAVWGMVILLPLAIVGGWNQRRHPLVQIGSLYALLLFVAMSVVFAFPGARGGLFHSGAAVLPLMYGLAVVGLDGVIAWRVSRTSGRRRWNALLARRVFGVSILVLAIALSGFIYYRQVLRNDAWNRVDVHYPALAAWVAAQDADAIVMIGNPPAYQYHGGGLSVVVPNENLNVTLQVIQRYGVDYLILDGNRPEPLASVHDQTETHPALTRVQSFGSLHVFAVNREALEP